MWLQVSYSAMTMFFNMGLRKATNERRSRQVRSAADPGTICSIGPGRGDTSRHVSVHRLCQAVATEYPTGQSVDHGQILPVGTSHAALKILCLGDSWQASEMYMSVGIKANLSERRHGKRECKICARVFQWAVCRGDFPRSNLPFLTSSVIECQLIPDRMRASHITSETCPYRGIRPGVGEYGLVSLA